MSIGILNFLRKKCRLFCLFDGELPWLCKVAMAMQQKRRSCRLREHKVVENTRHKTW